MLFEHAGLKAGQRVLVQGAAGNVGRYAIQIAHRAGIHVIAIAALKDAAALRELGADEILDRNAPGCAQVDAVIDLVGGENQNGLVDFLARGGALISSVKEPDETLCEQRGVRGKFILVNVRTADLAHLAALFDHGELETFVGTVLPLRAARTAHEMLAGVMPHGSGKIVLQVHP